MSGYTITCPTVKTHNGRLTDAEWLALPGHNFSLTATGEAPRQATYVRTCCDRDARLWLVRFDGDDDEIRSDFTEHDDPIFQQDVFEMFYSDTGESCQYKELETSPRNVTFDADITYHAPGKFTGNWPWTLEGWTSETTYDEASRRLTSVWAIPFDSLAREPVPGLEMAINFYRIDRSDKGDEFQAWSPTGSHGFHMPSRFGKVIFE